MEKNRRLPAGPASVPTRIAAVVRSALALVAAAGVLAVAAPAEAAISGQLKSVDAQGTVTGWAIDWSDTSMAATIKVTITTNGVSEDLPLRLTSVPDSDNRTDANTIGAHGFAFVLPPKFFDGRSHGIVAAAMTDFDVSPTVLFNSVWTFTLSNNPTIGQVDGVSNTGLVQGWSLDPSAGAAAEYINDVHLYVDTEPSPQDYSGFVGEVHADRQRVDVNNEHPWHPGNHGFSFQLPSRLFDGRQHRIYAYGISRAGGNVRFTNSGRPFTLLSEPIIGSVGKILRTVTSRGVPTATIQGWACQRDQSSAVAVDLFAGASAPFEDGGNALAGTKIARTTANLPLPDGLLPTDVVSECHAGTTARYFSFVISESDRNAYAGLRLFVRGVRFDGSAGADLPFAADVDGTMPFDATLASKLMPGVPPIYVTPPMLQVLRANNRTMVSSQVLSYLRKWPAGTPASLQDIDAVTPYFGTDYGAFIKAADNSLSQLPLIALACQMGSPTDSACSVGIQMLRKWATSVAPESDRNPPCRVAMPYDLHAGVAQFCPNDMKADLNPAYQAGLTLGRYLGQIAEGYQLLSAFITDIPTATAVQTRAAIEKWIGELGVAVRRSHELWNKNLGYEGANNHLSWHNYGMAVAGLVTKDVDMLRFAITEPANRGETQFVRGRTVQDLTTVLTEGHQHNFLGLITDAISETNNTKNIFRSESFKDEVRGCAVRYALSGDGQLRDGEVWDRYRNLDANHPEGAGFAYSMFHLEALVFTARLAEVNALLNGRESLWQKGDSKSAGSGSSLLKALTLYGNAFVDWNQGSGVPNPARRAPDECPLQPAAVATGRINYGPYWNEDVCSGRADLAGFIVSRAAFPTLIPIADGKVFPTVDSGKCASKHDDVNPTNGVPQVYLLIAHRLPLP